MISLWNFKYVFKANTNKYTVWEKYNLFLLVWPTLFLGAGYLDYEAGRHQKDWTEEKLYKSDTLGVKGDTFSEALVYVRKMQF